MPRGRKKYKLTPPKPETLNPTTIYEVQYVGPATGIQVAGLRFRKGVIQYMYGSQLALTIPVIKQWGLAFHEVKAEKRIAIILSDKKGEDSPDKNYIAIWEGAETRCVQLAGEQLIFKNKQPVPVNKKQAQALKRLGFKIQTK
jgi:hypothetical protein